MHEIRCGKRSKRGGNSHVFPAINSRMGPVDEFGSISLGINGSIFRRSCSMSADIESPLGNKLKKDITIENKGVFLALTYRN